MPGPINLTKGGSTITVTDPNEIATALDQGWKPETPTEHAADVGAEFQHEEYGGPVGKFAAAGTGALRTVTGGLSDVGLSAIGAAPQLRALREENPTSTVVGEIGGAFLPVGAVSAIGRVGRGISALGEGAGIAGRLGAAALGGAAEGALYGAGSGVSELALSDDPLTVERVGSALSSNMLYGAGLGAGIGTLAKGAEIGLGEAKQAVDGFLERRAAKATNPTDAILKGDLESIDGRILNAAEKSELERIHVEQAPQRQALTDELDAWRRSNRDTHDIREIAKGSDNPNLREASGAFDRANFQLRGALDDKIGFAEDPLGSLRSVRKQAQALEEMKAAAQGQERAWKEAVDTAPQRFRQMISEGKISGELGPFSSEGLDMAVSRAIKEHEGYYFEGAVRNGLKQPAIVSRIPKIDAMIEANGRLRAQLETLAQPPASELLGKIAEARAVLATPKAPSPGGALLSAAMPFAGPLGVAAATGNRVLGGLKNVVAAATERAAKATSTLLGAAEKGAAAAAPYAPVVATKVLAAVRYNDQRHAEEPKDLHEAYTRATDAIKSQIAVTPDGQYQLRPDARAKMASKFDGIRTSAPILADRLEEHSARRIEYLAGEIPRKPDVFALHSGGPDTWRPATMEIAAFARKVAAVEDPHAMLDRLAHGEVTSEDSAAIRAVYPELMRDITEQVTSQMHAVKALAYNKKIALSIFTGQPADPSLDPKVIAALQSMYPAEPGSHGGAQTPRAEPNFGAMKSATVDAADARTPAQERAA